MTGMLAKGINVKSLISEVGYLPVPLVKNIFAEIFYFCIYVTPLQLVSPNRLHVCVHALQDMPEVFVIWLGFDNFLEGSACCEYVDIALLH